MVSMLATVADKSTVQGFVHACCSCNLLQVLTLEVWVQLLIAKDPEAAFFKKLEGLQPCEMSELKAGTHIFAVYGKQ